MIIITSARCEYIEKSNTNTNQNVNQQNKLRNELMKSDECNPIDIDRKLLDWQRIITSVKSHWMCPWLDREKPASWSRKEIKCLKRIVKRNAGYNWIAIHKEFMVECRAQNMDKNRSILIHAPNLAFPSIQSILPYLNNVF
eukprot:211516_1